MPFCLRPGRSPASDDRGVGVLPAGDELLDAVRDVVVAVAARWSSAAARLRSHVRLGEAERAQHVAAREQFEKAPSAPRSQRRHQDQLPGQLTLTTVLVAPSPAAISSSTTDSVRWSSPAPSHARAARRCRSSPGSARFAQLLLREVVRAVPSAARGEISGRTARTASCTARWSSVSRVRPDPESTPRRNRTMRFHRRQSLGNDRAHELEVVVHRGLGLERRVDAGVPSRARQEGVDLVAQDLELAGLDQQRRRPAASPTRGVIAGDVISLSLAYWVAPVTRFSRIIMSKRSFETMLRPPRERGSTHGQ